MDNTPIHILSLGAGVQSSAEAFMAEAGVIQPRPHSCGFGDTKGEPKEVYKWLAYMKSKLSIPIWERSRGSLAEDSLKIFTSQKTGKRYMKGLIPAFVLNDDGSKGLMGRKCTPDYKIAMIVRMAREIVGKKRFSIWRKKHKTAIRAHAAYKRLLLDYKKAKKEKVTPLPEMPMPPQWAVDECKSDPIVVMWIGISTDEAHRMKESQELWIKTRWPLIELGLSREDCLKWMKDNGHPEPPRSACTFCPFHSDDEWIRLRNESPEEFEDAVKYEQQLQEAARNQEALRGIPFLHDSCIPLDMVPFKPTEPGRKQVSMFGNECEGLCGV